MTIPKLLFRTAAFLMLLSGPALAACDAARYPIAVDIGHTAQSPGAISAHGRGEFEFNLALGQEVASALRSAGFPVRTILVEGAGKAQLAKRVDRANAAAPRLLISIHHDSVQQRYLKTWEFDGRLLKHSDRFSGFSLFVSRANPRFETSVRFATLIADGLLENGLNFSPHHAEDIAGEKKPLLDRQRGIYEFKNLRVLKDVRMPSVLLEAGVIVNRKEEIALATPPRREAIGSAVALAAIAMCGGEGGKLALR
jgi:N-acetylmuramoyl-L-alanine amidase